MDQARLLTFPDKAYSRPMETVLRSEEELINTPVDLRIVEHYLYKLTKVGDRVSTPEDEEDEDEESSRDFTDYKPTVERTFNSVLVHVWWARMTRLNVFNLFCKRHHLKEVMNVGDIPLPLVGESEEEKHELSALREGQASNVLQDIRLIILENASQLFVDGLAKKRRKKMMREVEQNEDALHVALQQLIMARVAQRMSESPRRNAAR